MSFKDPIKQKAYLTQHYEARKAYVIAAKNKPCADCKQSFPYYVMDFDHVRGEKIGTLNNLRWSKGITKLQEEIDKCDVVCANCHRVRTHKRQSGVVE